MDFLLQSICSLAILLIEGNAEWIEITQTPKVSVQSRRPNTRILKKSNANFFTDVINRNEYLNDDQFTTPSPYWVEYQRERFSNNKKMKNSNSQKFIVSGETNLKTSAKIIVPASTIFGNNENSNSALRNITIAKKNRFFRAKSRLDVINDKPDVELIELPLKPSEQQTTPRRSSSDNPQSDDTDDTDDTDDHDDDDDDVDDGIVENSYDDGDDEKPVNSTNNNSHPTTNDNHLEYPSLQGFIRFIKTIHKTWLKKSGFNFENNIRILKNLRDSLMRRIEKQFALLWPLDDNDERRLRNKRSLLDESNLNFPPEAALMSINFLTFAVFLIKLVLQVINIVKSKHYNFSGFQTTTDPMVKANS